MKIKLKKDQSTIKVALFLYLNNHIFSIKMFREGYSRGWLVFGFWIQGFRIQDSRFKIQDSASGFRILPV
jgi:hypothetical protein